MKKRLVKAGKQDLNIRLAADTDERYTPEIDFSKIKVGLQTLPDAIVTYGSYQRANPRLGTKANVLKAITDGDVKEMRQISNFFYKSSGIYSRLCRYMAYLYKYDWFVTPYLDECQGLLDTNAGLYDTTQNEALDEKTRKKQFINFFRVLKFLDEFEIKRFCGKVALKVVKNGCFYGYLIAQNNKVVVQELLPDYCRSRFEINNRPAIEFDMRFFDIFYKDTQQRERVLNLFPKEFKEGYKKYKQKKIPPAFPGDSGSWWLLDYRCTIKFNLNDNDYPPFISVIPYLIDLDAAQDLDRKRMAQKLLKIIIQKMPIDKNGDLIFDIDEAQALHNNAVKMLGRAIGIDVLTTFAQVDVADMSDRGNQSNLDELEKVERTVFNEAGVSQMQFNSDSNTALNNSILNDESSMYDLLLQFESFLNLLIQPFNKSPKKNYYKAQFLNTTIYNYKEVSKLYKEQMQIGFSKMLPQVALGQTQSSILATAYFENDILDLVRVFIPPMMSSTMNAEALAGRKDMTGKEGNKDASSGNGTDTGGRPEKPDNQKSDKTIQNRESM